MTRDEWNDYIVRANGALDKALRHASRISGYLHQWSDRDHDLGMAEAHCRTALDAIRMARENFDLAEPGQEMYGRKEVDE